MSHAPLTQLDKVLALADSNHDGEAVVAVRKARQLLSRDGLSFGDLARAASRKPGMSLPFGFRSASTVTHLEVEVVRLRQKLDDLQDAMQTKTAQAEQWRRRAEELEIKSQTSQAEARRWQKLARDTVEKLWDLGQSLRDEPPQATAPLRTAQR